jgi:hypothetical protein
VGRRLTFGLAVPIRAAAAPANRSTVGRPFDEAPLTDKSGRVTTAAVRAYRGTESSNPFPSSEERRTIGSAVWESTRARVRFRGAGCRVLFRFVVGVGGRAAAAHLPRHADQWGPGADLVEPARLEW